MRNKQNLNNITVIVRTLNEEKNIVDCIQSIKKSGIKKSIIKGLNDSADITLKFAHDLGEVINLKPKVMSKNNEIEVRKLSQIAKKDFNQLTRNYGLLCKNLVENQKQRIDYWENKGNKKIK